MLGNARAIKIYSTKNAPKNQKRQIWAQILNFTEPSLRFWSFKHVRSFAPNNP
ncbi:hypothetical protein CAMRE0001_2971 [Campylobacter rectus RM3267]|uniref:Uncharacterized protein n=1 Tax=Campylobacter rectus RM3267 TaxID=553218 RepID=B9D623_CAMRE|nr:hypothetical protein CAMRE0001_2971 [Campylobacter rectus RM3267]